MEKFDVEKELKKAVNEIEVRDFSKVWEEIKDGIKIPNETKKKRSRWIYALASVAACLIIFCAVGLPLLLRNNEIVYFDDDLIVVDVEEVEFWKEINSSNLNIVNLNRYNSEGVVYLLQTEKGVIKGGKISFFNDENNPVYLIGLKFNDDKVQESDEIEYNEIYSVNGANIEYKFLFEQDLTWNYIAKANYNGVNYYMEIMALSEDITPFFDEFFNAN